MTKHERQIAQALEIIAAAGVPVMSLTKKRQRRMAQALLAVANLTPRKQWSSAAVWEGADSHCLTTREIIAFWNKHFGEKVSPGSYDDVRRRDLIHLIAAGLVTKSAANPSASTNDPSRGYAVSVEAGPLLRLYGTPQWPDAAAEFVASAGNLTDRINRQRKLAMVVATLPDGKLLELSPGPHNEIQRAIIEQFLPRFVPGAEVLYVGDTSKKVLVLESERLKTLGFFELSHDLLPDVVAYDKSRNWLILIEAVHSANPMSPIRHLALEEMTKRCTAPRVYVSAFETRKSLSRWLHEISWETEVWVMDSPDHMIHFNGVRFLGPYPGPNEQVPRG